MIIKFILLNILIGLCRSIKIQGKECSCEDEDIKICEKFSKCSINGNVCGDLICENRLSEDLCDPKKNNYKCKWDAQTQKCQEYTYTCSEIDYGYCQFGNCLEDQPNEICVDFSCSEVQRDCPIHLCSFSSENECSEREELDCSILPYSLCNFYYDGYGHVCNLNDQDKCMTYNVYGEHYSGNPLIKCSEWSDSKINCKRLDCYYDEEQKQCRKPKCTEITIDSQCREIEDEYESNIYELCKWDQNGCSQLELADTQILKVNRCSSGTQKRFKWTEKFECQPCQSVKIIKYDPDLCYWCFSQLNTFALLNKKFSHLIPTCCNREEEDIRFIIFLVLCIIFFLYSIFATYKWLAYYIKNKQNDLQHQKRNNEDQGNNQDQGNTEGRRNNREDNQRA